MINITARGFELKQGTKDGIEKELKRIEKMLPDSAEFDVTLAKKKDGYKCDITVVNVGSFIRGEAQADRIEPVVDMAVDDLKESLESLKLSSLTKRENAESTRLQMQSHRLMTLRWMTLTNLTH